MNNVLEEYCGFPIDAVRNGERVLVYCRVCNRELDLDEVIHHAVSSEEFPNGHSVHFTIEKG